MNDIIDHKHSFKIGDEDIELIITYIDGIWSSDILKGDTGTGFCIGGKFNTLGEYVEHLEKQHIYSYKFFQKNVKNAILSGGSKMVACDHCGHIEMESNLNIWSNCHCGRGTLKPKT